MYDSRENSVRNLENLYTVVVGLGLSIAIYNVVINTLLSDSIKLEIIPFFVSFLVTLIPFYHGALRHLDVTYIEKRGSGIRKGAFLIDFLLLFMESCIFIGLAVLLPTPYFFVWCLVVLFATDVIWGFIAHLAFSHDVESKAESSWALINLITTALLILGLIAIRYIPENEKTSVLWIGTLVVTAVRTVVDYIKNWEFYLPENNNKE